MNIIRKILAASAAVVLLSGIGATQASAKDIETARAAAVVQPSPNTVDSNELINGGVFGWDMADNTIPWLKMGSQLRGEIRLGQQRGADALAKANQALAAVNNLPQSPTFLANWGEIYRNTIANGSSELGQSSAGEGLKISTPAGTDQTTFGNETDYAGKPVAQSAIKYTVFTTGENVAKSATGNMPGIKFEISNPAGSATYTTLVYAPGNSAPNTWTTIDAKNDAEKHWGFTGTYFNGADVNDKCGMNGARCTYAEAIAVLGDNAKLLSVAVGKGRDYEFHGAVKDLTIGADKFIFTKNGVTK